MDEESRNDTEGQETPSPQTPETPPEQPPRTSGLAIASLVLAILGVVTCVGIVVLGPIALILGIIAMVQIGRNPQALRGMGMAIAGVVISGIAILVIPILAAILFPVFAQARARAQQITCLNNVKQLSTAMQMYLDDYDVGFPPTANWNDALQPYTRQLLASKGGNKVWVCPSAKSEEPCYAMNGLLDSIQGRDVRWPADTVSIFESIPGKNQTGGKELLPSPPRHRVGHSVGYVDGHVRFVSDSATESLNWEPFATAIPKSPPPYEKIPLG